MKYRSIKGYEGYFIFEDGRIFSNKSKKFLSQRTRGRTSRQYYMVTLFDSNGKRKNLSVHRLVAETFIPNPENKPVVNHKDNNPFNNHVDNLEWVTSSENTLHSYNSTTRKPSYKKVAKIDRKTGEILEVFNSVKEAGDSINAHYTQISKVLSGKRKTTGGYVWKYVEKEGVM